MLRILAQVTIYGGKDALSPLMANSAIPNGKLKQLGLLRKTPDTDSWAYSSPYYRFHFESLSEELYDFLSKHYLLEPYKLNEKEGIEYSLLTVIPVEQSFEETFSCLLSNETLSLLSKLGLSLQIAPAVTMPETPFWSD